jgi:cytochrome c-type biogenesis protein CcmH
VTLWPDSRLARAVVVLLVYWAIRDAQPTTSTTPQPMASTAPPHETRGEIPPELAAQITDLETRLMNDPQDLMARKQLALTYVATGQFFEAFEQATQVLQVEPQDPDGLLVHGMVRLTMGQTDQAVAVLDQVLAQVPDHRQALIYRGLALYQGGRVGQALDTWDMGLQLAGGSDPEFEELILMAQSGAAQPAGMTDPASASPPTPQQSAPPAPTSVDPEAYNLTIHLAQGVAPAPQATLFVFLRPEDGGPPVAVRRIPRPSFPVSLALGAADSMMGDDLPATGILVAKLDADGNVASSGAQDLQSESAARKGEVLQLTLAR